MSTVRIPLISTVHPGLHVTVDRSDLRKVSRYKWYPSLCQGKFYASAYTGGGRTNPRRIRMHRLLLSPESGEEVDHANGDGLDNRRSNLRIATRSQNMANIKKAAGTSSVYKGVNWDRSRGKWQAKVRLSGKTKNLGRFDAEEDAARAYDEAAYREFGEFAVLNFPSVEG